MTDLRPVEAHTYLSHRYLAVDLNNAGSSMMNAATKAARLHDELLLLRKATETYRDALEALGKTAVPVTAEHTDAFEEYLAFRDEHLARLQNRMNEVADLPLPSQLQENEAYDSLIYADPILLEPTIDHSQDSHGGQSLEEMSASVLFNLALAHHLHGERSGSRAHIERAVRFYKMTETMVFKALLEPQEQRGESSDHLMATIIKGVMNNMGQICIQWMGETQLGKEYFARLVSMSFREPVPKSNEEMSPMDEFSFNAMVASCMNTAGAA